MHLVHYHQVSLLIACILHARMSYLSNSKYQQQAHDGLIDRSLLGARLGDIRYVPAGVPVRLAESAEYGTALRLTREDHLHVPCGTCNGKQA